MHTCIPWYGLKRSWHSCPTLVNAGDKNTPSMHHSRRWNVTTSMVGMKNGYICKNLTQNGEPQRYSLVTQKKKKKKKTKLKSHSVSWWMESINRWRRGGNLSTWRKPSTTSFRKWPIMQPLTETQTHTLVLVISILLGLHLSGFYGFSSILSNLHKPPCEEVCLFSKTLWKDC